ncbi:MAG: HAMP domain-containing histidine kinase, partial [Archangium sp.]|nr:HAMP domain-containing histidine kinase [Archangium sp.]
MASRTLLSRLTLGTVLAAGAAATLSAVVCSATAAWLVQRAEDKNLVNAAITLATELDSGEHGAPEETLRHETAELSHAGIVFAVARPSGERLEGDARVPLPGAGSCISGSALRACAVGSKAGFTVAAAAAHSELGFFFVAAALLATLLAAAAAFAAGRPLSRTLLEPMSRLQERIDALGPGPGDVGPEVGLLELDRLRAAVLSLHSRLADALAHAERFAADAAHELRTPLTAVRAELELLAERQSEIPAELKQALATVARLGGLIDKLLVLARPLSETHLANEAVSLRDVVEDVLAELPAPERERVTVHGEADATVRGDPTLLHAMLSNAISNALKFGSRAAVEVVPEPSDAEAVLRVDDDGPGVPQAERDRVFQPFVRSARARTEGVAGHGLGLALIRHIARLHGGTATFEDV